jgi:hypothetical protein
MAIVNPRLQRIPKALLQDRETRLYFEDIERFLHDLWIRTGGGDDDVANQSLRELYPWSVSATESSHGLFSYFDSNHTKTDFDVIEVIGTTHTTRGNEIVVCNNTALLTVTLNPDADHKEQAIIVRNNTGSVRVTATKLISGQLTKTILRRYSAPHHIFTTEADSWSVI